jgi:hypothetical protein
MNRNFRASLQRANGRELRAWRARWLDMAMEEYSILVGKVYRTPDNEMREVHALDKGDVIYLSVAATRGPGWMMKEQPRRLPLAQFAREVESEVSPPS